MSIDTRREIDLSSKTISDWLLGTELTFTETPTSDWLDTNFDSDPAAEKDLTESISSLSLFVSNTYEYLIVKRTNDAPVGTTISVVPEEFKVKIELFAVLWLASDLSETDKNKAKNAFKNFDYKRHGNATDFAHQTGIPAEKFLVETLFKISRSQVQGVFHKEQDDAIRKRYLDNDEFFLKQLKTTRSRDFSARRSEAEESENPSESIENDIDDMLSKLNCDGVRLKEKIFIGTLLAYPEWKIEPENVFRKLGCNWIKLEVPVLKWRLSEEQLYAYAGWVSYEDYLNRTVLRCLENAAKDPKVWLAALESLKVAMGVFIALYRKCVVEDLVCAVANLKLVKVSHKWKTYPVPL